MSSYVYPVRTTFAIQGDKDHERVERGTAVAVATEGGVLFLTAAHVVSPQRDRKGVVVLLGGNEREARVLRSDNGLDAAVLQVPAYDGKGIPLAERPPAQGRPVFIFGFPVKYAGAAVPKLIATAGEVVRTDYSYEEIKKPVLQVKGSSHLGGSGGALVEDGKLSGLVFACRFVGDSATHVYAIPVSELTELLKK
jgi:hypothetical protein